MTGLRLCGRSKERESRNMKTDVKMRTVVICAAALGAGGAGARRAEAATMFLTGSAILSGVK